MSVSSTRTSSIAYAGDVVGVETVTSAVNALSPGQIEFKSLASGANTITVPIIALISIPTSVTIIPPAVNAVALTIKGVTGDTGVRIHNTDPTVIALDPSVTTFCLTAGSALAGVRFLWA